MRELRDGGVTGSLGLGVRCLFWLLVFREHIFLYIYLLILKGTLFLKKAEGLLETPAENVRWKTLDFFFFQ